MKLEHLAPYLPYGLKVQGQPTKEILELGGLDGNIALLVGRGRIDFFDIKPILRPLSDLTKEIEHNGGKFVPLDWFDKEYAPLGCSHEEMKEHFLKDTLKNLSYSIVQKLLEWHFDIFGLIEKGEAIDINTI